MKIGFIGLGMVGKAIYDVLSEYNETCFYDVKIEGSKIEDILVSDVVFVAVPTIPDENNNCDLSILNNVMEQLYNLRYNGVICIKSTIIPETTKTYIVKYNNDKICFCPEFLRERCAYEDFKFNNKICIVGTDNEEVYELIKNCHSKICVEFRMVPPVEAELTKYFQNVFNTNRILFANAFYEVCKYNNVSYNNIVENLLVRKEIDEKYIRCSDEMRGPSGPCLVKDTLAFNEYTKKIPLTNRPELFQTLVNDMKLYPKTVIKGTRSEIEYFGKEIGKEK
jgi:UDPglucose 6-dehydrogenase